MVNTALTLTLAAPTSLGGRRSTIVVHWCGRTLSPFVTSRPPLPPFVVHPHVGDNSVDTCRARRRTHCGHPEDNPCMTARSLGVTAGFPDPSCGRPEPVPRRTELSTAGVHPSYTEPWAAPPATTGLVHRIHRPYDNDETYINGSSPEYLGKEQLLIQPRTGNLRGTTGRVLAGGPGGIRVSAHRCMRLPAQLCVEGRVYR